MIKLGVSSYSFHRYGKGPEKELHDLLDMMSRAARFGFSGVELLATDFEDTSVEYLAGLKFLAAKLGLDIAAVSCDNNFVKPDAVERRAQIDHVCRWIDIASYLGSPLLRLLGGRWETIKDFSEFMEAEGEEPPIPGYTEIDANRWNDEGFAICAHYARMKGIVLAVETHWGFTGTAERAIRIVEAAATPFLRAALDIGNFPKDTYRQIEAVAPYAAHVHAKTYAGGGIFYTLDLDYERIVRKLRDVGYRGYVCLEYEGKELPETGIPKGLEVLMAALERSRS